MTAASFTVRDLIALRRVGAPALSPCGRFAAFTVQRLDDEGARYVTDLWRVALDTPGAAPVQLTRGRHNDTAPAWRRDGALAFLSTRPVAESAPADEDERAQVWLLPASGGEPRPLTDEPLGVSAFAFARAADRLIVAAARHPDVPAAELRAWHKERRKQGPTALRYDRMPIRSWDHWLPPTVTHLIALGADGADPLDLTPDARHELAEPQLDVSEDGATLVTTWMHRSPDRLDNAALVLIDLATQRRQTLATRDDGGWQRPRFLPGGRAILATVYHRHATRSWREHLERFDLDAGTSREIGADLDLLLTLHDLSPDGAFALCTADQDGHTPIWLLSTEADGAHRRLDAGPGAFSELRAAGPEGLVALRSDLRSPPELHHLALNASSAAPRPLTALSGATADLASRLTLERYDTPSSDGTNIQWWLLRPADLPAPAPALLWVHGGPVGAWADGWHWRWNALTAAHQGYAVAMPNLRGSTGFGYGFIDPIWGNTWGEQCYQDVLAVSDALAAHPAVDSGRIAAMGGSFGGYMMNWLGANTAGHFKALVTHASIFHLSAFAATTDFAAWWAHGFGLDPFSQRDAFDRFSPSHHVAAWKTPTLVIHGERDYRCPIGEALALFEALQRYEVEAELLVFPDEGHYILRPRNIIAWYETIFDFLQRRLGAPAQGEGALQSP